MKRAYYNSMVLLATLSFAGCDDSPTRDPAEQDLPEQLVATSECPMPMPASAEQAQADVEDFVACLGYEVDSVRVDCESRHRWLFPAEMESGLGGAWVIGKTSVACAYRGEAQGELVFQVGQDVLEASGIDGLMNLGPESDECLGILARMHHTGVASEGELATAWAEALVCDGHSRDGLQFDCWGPCYDVETFYACRIVDLEADEQVVVVATAD